MVQRTTSSWWRSDLFTSIAACCQHVDNAPFQSFAFLDLFYFGFIYFMCMSVFCLMWIHPTYAIPTETKTGPQNPWNCHIGAGNRAGSCAWIWSALNPWALSPVVLITFTSISLNPAVYIRYWCWKAGLYLKPHHKNTQYEQARQCASNRTHSIGSKKNPV